MLNATTQGIASGVGSFSEAGEPARRTGTPELTLAEKLRDGFTPGSGAGARPRATESGPAIGPPPRGTAAYEAYLREMLNGTTQGIASGVGSLSEAGEPARRMGAKQPRPFSLLPSQDDELAVERVTVRPASGSGTIDGPPARGTAAYEAYLREMLNATPQGIAPGVGSFSEVGEPARRTGVRELTLAEKLRDGFTEGSGPRESRPPSIGDLREREKRLLRNMEPTPVRGPGARMFEVTPDEESFWAAISPDEFISEELIEIHRRGEFTDDDIAVMEEYSPEAGQRAELIAYYDKQGVRGSNDADALRAGAMLPGGDWGIGIPQPVEDAGRWVGDKFVESQRQQNQARERFFQEAQDVGGDLLGAARDAIVENGLREHEQRQLEADGYEWLWDRRAEGRERVTNANVGALTANPLDWDDPSFIRWWDGLMKNRDFLGEENPIRDVLPEFLEEPAVWSTEKLADPVTIAEILAAIYLPLSKPVRSAPIVQDFVFDAIDGLFE
jgi:hypothetical protein